MLDAACVGGAVMVGGFVFLIYTYVGAYDILMRLGEAIVTSLMYIIFKKAHGLIANRKKRTQTAQDELISISVSVGVFITGLSGIVFPYNISLANIVSVYAVLCICLLYTSTSYMVRCCTATTAENRRTKLCHMFTFVCKLFR